jgi:hypothetical protein
LVEKRAYGAYFVQELPAKRGERSRGYFLKNWVGEGKWGVVGEAVFQGENMLRDEGYNGREVALKFLKTGEV